MLDLACRGGQRTRHAPGRVGEGGRTLKAIGTHARKRLEQLLGQRVYLETWVKVLPKWRRDPAQLSRFGFPDLPAERP